MYLSGPSNLSKLKNVIRRELSCIHLDLLHSAIAGFVTRQQCVIPCGGAPTAVINDLEVFFTLFAYLFFKMFPSAPSVGCFLSYFSSVLKKIP